MWRAPRQREEQLGTTLDTNITNLKVHGACGLLFKITSESHGYTFVGKGNIDVFVSDLKHEGVVYNRLRSLQGESIPVYLGNIDLIKRKWYEYGMRILHMLLMSYGGTPIYSTDESMRLQVHQFEAKLDRLGVQHRDLTRPNMLWNQELQRLVFIDFERSRLEPRVNKTPTRVLQELSPSKLQNQRSPSKKSANKPSVSLEEGVKKTPAPFTVLDEENMTRKLPILSPKRMLIDELWSNEESSEQQSPDGKRIADAPPLPSSSSTPLAEDF
ncbi:MAG: hypothetical protein Q9172_003528 [Xanthocarpia lactea]